MEYRYTRRYYQPVVSPDPTGRILTDGNILKNILVEVRYIYINYPQNDLQHLHMTVQITISWLSSLLFSNRKGKLRNLRKS